MAIKPIEKNNDNAIVMKLGFLIFLIGLGFFLNKITAAKKQNVDVPQVLSGETERIDLQKNAESIAENLVSKSKEVTGQILGDATDTMSEIASKSADTISSFIIEKATDPIVDQIKKLPQSQQEEIKKNICN